MLSVPLKTAERREKNMYWYKAKNILIILFAVINILLLSLLASSHISAEKDAKKLQDSLVAVMETNGISADKSIFSAQPRKMQSFNVENMADDSISFAAAFIGGGCSEETDENGVKSYVCGDKRLYAANGRISLVSAVSERAQTEDDVKAAKTFFDSIGVPLENTDYQIADTKIFFTYLINGDPLFINGLTVSMGDGAPVSCEGYLLKILDSASEPSKTRTVLAVMTDYLRDPTRPEGKVRVTDVKTGYAFLFGSPSVDFKFAEAVPTYRVTIDDKYLFYYDGR